MLENFESDILPVWMDAQLAASSKGPVRLPDSQLREQSLQFLTALRPAAQNGNLSDISTAEWSPVRDMLTDLSRSRVRQGATPSQTAAFIFSLRQPLLLRLERDFSSHPDYAGISRAISLLVDTLGLYTMEVYQKNREEVIARQQQEMLELSTPVVQLWDGFSLSR